MWKKLLNSFVSAMRCAAATFPGRVRSSSIEAANRPAATLLVTALALLMSPGIATAGERVALVIGNSAYDHVSSLKNPSNDASDIAAALGNAGFDVEAHLDLSQQEMLRALQRFGQRSFGAEMAVVYYAGHGIEVGRQNYLIPVSAELKSDLDVAFEAVELDRALLAVEGARKLRLVIVDACRDNPFTVRMRQTSQTRSIGRGLAAVEPSAATLVAYAAKEGTVANDGNGRNSPYAAALLDVLAEPGVEISKVFRRVRDRVLSETNGTQEPFVYGSLPADDIYLYPAALAPEPPQPAPSTNKTERDLAFWRSISGSSDARDYEDFLTAFPESVFAGLAQRRLESLRPDAETGVSNPLDVPETEDRLALLTPDTPAVELTPDPEPAPEITRELVRFIQLQLNALGHNSGAPDGIIGRRTKSGISGFQATLNLEASGEIEAELLKALAGAISVDRAAVDYAVVRRYGLSERAGQLRGLYCLQNPDGTLADGKAGRDMLCHYIRPSRGRVELRSYYSHVRLSEKDPVIGVIARLRRQDGDSYISDTGTVFEVTASEIVMGPNRYLRTN